MIFVLSVAFAFGLPFAQTARETHQASLVVADIRGFIHELETIARQKGDWPARATEPGQYPEGLATTLEKTGWSRPTPIGGFYTWAPNSLHRGERFHAAIGITATSDSRPTKNRRVLTAIDHLLDDGNLATGKFRLGYRDEPIVVIEH